MTKIHVLGAAHEVGRSGFLLHHKNSNILLDYGVKLEPTGISYPLVPDVKIQSIVLSHAHLDHSGMIPNLFKKNNPLVYMTPPTLDISNILWDDTIKISQKDGIKPIFDKTDIFNTNRKTQLISYKQEAKVAPEMKISMFDAGHILGSALTNIELDNSKNILYTGDYKFEETRLHSGADIEVGKVDYLITESTYGDRNHPSRDKVEKEFIKAVKNTLENDGIALIPAFAVGRAQEIVDLLDEFKIHDYPIFLDGMAQKVAKIYMKYPGYYKNPFELRKSFSNAIWIKNHRQRKQALERPSIVITTAGMLEGGPIMYYIKHKANDKRTNIFMTGFQVPETKGNILLQTGEIEIDDEVYRPKGIIKKFDFSAHVGKKYLLKAINHWNPQKVICVHGDNRVVDEFVNTIEHDLGIKAVAPKIDDFINLD